MARAWIEDLWLTDAVVMMSDGSTIRKPPTAAMKRSLAAHPNDPMKARVPPEHRTARYGQGKRWRVNWRAAGPDGLVKKKTKAFADYKDAESFVAAMEDDIRSGRYVNPDDGNRSFAQVAREWLNSKNNLRDSSYVGYEKSLRWYVLPKWGDRPIGGITEAEINEWVKQLAAGTAPHDFKRKTEMQPLKAKTLKAVVKDAFGGVMGYAAAPKRRWIAANPMDGVALPQSKTADDRVFLTNAQVESLAEAAGLDGIEGLCVHSLRHTYASLAIAAGCDVKTLQTVMRHASATETLNTYTALWPDRLDDVTHAIEANYAAWRTEQQQERQ